MRAPNVYCRIGIVTCHWQSSRDVVTWFQLLLVLISCGWHRETVSHRNESCFKFERSCSVAYSQSLTAQLSIFWTVTASRTFNLIIICETFWRKCGPACWERHPRAGCGQRHARSSRYTFESFFFFARMLRQAVDWFVSQNYAWRENTFYNKVRERS